VSSDWKLEALFWHSGMVARSTVLGGHHHHHHHHQALDAFGTGFRLGLKKDSTSHDHDSRLFQQNRHKGRRLHESLRQAFNDFGRGDCWVSISGKRCWQRNSHLRAISPDGAAIRG